MDFTKVLVTWVMLFSVSVLFAKPTDLREWTATSGHKLKAVAVSVTDGKVSFKRENGKTVKVPMVKLSEDDQTFLTKHFNIGAEKNSDADTQTEVDEGEVADGLAYPLGKTTAEISCGEGFSYFLYLPKSLRKGQLYPVLFLMSPGGGGAGTAKRYIPGAERNRWIVAVSKQSKNGYAQSGSAIEAMMNHVEENLPIDKKRVYVSGMSGGSRMAYRTSQKRKEVTGIIACGAGGEIGNRKQIVYGLCGTNCYNRTDMADAFERVSHKGAILRYFPGRHTWANAELCEDAITHLNGVFLSKNRSNYRDDYTAFCKQVGLLVSANETSHPFRAYMWADFAQTYKIDSKVANKAYSLLGSDSLNESYVKGLKGVRKFAEKTFGKTSGSSWKADPKISAACKREAKKYLGTPWEEVLNKMSEDAQKF